MKKIYTLAAFIMMSATTFAQSVVTADEPIVALNANGSLEDWPTANTQPSGWTMPTNLFTSGDVSKKTTGAQDGTNYVELKHYTSADPSSTYNQIGLTDINVIPGISYTIKYWYKGENMKFRHWGQWRTENSTSNIPPASGTTEPFQPSAFVASSSTWKEQTITSTAPATAKVLRVNFRNYKDGATVSIDNVTVYVTPASGVKEDNIDGLNVFPNPAKDIVNIVSNGVGAKKVMLFDVVGKKVLDATTEETIDVSSLKAGIYMMKISQDGKSATRKLVIK